MAPGASAEKLGSSCPQIGIQNYSTTSSCQARASQARSDYGTLFVVLVVIGAICVIIIVLGLLYNCWQRRLPKLKHVVSVRAGGEGACVGADWRTACPLVQSSVCSVLVCRWDGSHCPGTSTVGEATI